jgi:uncharacterized membrane protein YuzA (DUF378 family)
VQHLITSICPITASIVDKEGHSVEKDSVIFGRQDATVSRIVYILVGLAALYSIYTSMKVNARNP